MQRLGLGYLAVTAPLKSKVIHNQMPLYRPY